jgi:chondroitin synthase
LILKKYFDMKHKSTLILGYDYSLSKKIPWNKIPGESKKVIVISTGLASKVSITCPKKSYMKVLSLRKFILELINSWRVKYHLIILLEPYLRLKAYAMLARAAEKKYFNKYDEQKKFNHKDVLEEILKTIIKKILLSIIQLKYAIKIKGILGTENDHSFIQKRLKKFHKTYSLKASIIIPVYNRKKMLDKTLAALTHQTYPLNLLEVIIADDGSSDNIKELLKKYSNYFDIKMVSQEDKGYRLAAIRNKAIQASHNEVAISLDCDIIPVPELIEEYMKWFHVTEKNIVVIGILKHVNSDNISAEDILKDPNILLQLEAIMPHPERRDLKYPTRDWRISMYKKTDFLKKHPHPYIVAGGGNMAFWRKWALIVGGFDEDFTKWGGEDDVFNYNLYKKGAYFIPEPNAIGLHQEHNDGSSYRSEGRAVTRRLLGKKIPLYRHFLSPMDDWEEPRVSIFMRSYNAEQYIQDAIESALNQTYQDLEVCIVDDGSTDRTLQIIKNNYKNNKRVRWVVQDHKGPAAAMNAAIDLCRGEYLGQLDGDDLLYPTAVEELVKFFEKHNEYGVVYSGYEIIGENGEFVSREKTFKKYNKDLLMRKMIVTPFRMFKSKYWYRIEGIDEDLFAAVDYDLSIKLCTVCNFCHYRKVLYKYRKHDFNITNDPKKTEYYTELVRKRARLRSKKQNHIC